MTTRSRTAVRIVFASALVFAAAAPVHAQGPARAPNEPDTQPVLLTRDLPRLTTQAYPRHLRAHPIPGSVDVRFKILENGRVDSATVQIAATSNPVFDVPAVQVALKLRFQAAMLEGEPVPVWVTFPIHFGPWSDGTSTVTQQDNRMFPYHPPRP